MIKKPLVILVILTVIIIVSIFLLFNSLAKSSANQTPENEDTTPQPSIQPSITPVAEDIDIFTTLDSNLQMQYPSSWIINQSLPKTSPDILEIVEFSSTNPDGTQLILEVSEQYDKQIENLTQCQTDTAKTCETKLVSDKLSVVETSQDSNPKTVAFYSIFARKIYKLSFTIPQGPEQVANIELVNKVISTLKLF